MLGNKRVGVEHIDLRRTAGEEQADDVLRFATRARTRVMARHSGASILSAYDRAQTDGAQCSENALNHFTTRRAVDHGQKIYSLVESKICAYGPSAPPERTLA